MPETKPMRLQVESIVREELTNVVKRKMVEEAVSEAIADFLYEFIDEKGKSTDKWDSHETKTDDMPEKEDERSTERRRRKLDRSKDSSNSHKQDDFGKRYRSVMKSLQDDAITKSDIMRQLWHPKDQKDDDTKRSLFSKKANGTPDDDGFVRHFTTAEINRLYDIIRNIGK